VKLAFATAFLAVSAVIVSAPSAVAQQVGYPPSSSPYHDLTAKQEFTFYGGYFGGSTGDAKVGPQSGPVFGVRYGIHLGGPAEFTVHLARVSSTRTVLNPSQTGTGRVVGSTSLPLYLSDVGITLDLTGRKSYHRLVPIVGFGLGVASDLGEKPDVGGFKVGTPFALTFGTGLRYVPGGKVAMRLEVSDYMYQIKYPSAYFTAPTGGVSILPQTSGTGQWLHNAVLTLGISYLLSH
jgi:hypothetical protein